jgi:fatty-acyl-CoA synthase
MRLKARIQREIRFLSNLNRTLGRIKSIAPDNENLSCDDFEAAVDQFREREALFFEGAHVTYGELDALANRYASWARDQNLRRGQVVTLVMPNRLEYLAIWMGLAKVGVVTALINNQLTGQALCHCLNTASAGHILVDGETLAAVEAVRGQLTKHPIIWTLSQPHGDQRDLTKALKGASSLRPDRSIRKGLEAKDTALLIFTSGTTGLPKAARITHERVQLYMRGFAASTNSKPDDRIYIALPLYHATGGLCATGAALMNGGTIVLKAKFTATHFWRDITDNRCTMFVYIGELCRYLVNQPPSDLDSGHRLRLIFGNGLRGDVWEKMLHRFHVGDVLEFYGSTEGNVSLFNFDGKVGAIARIPRYLRKKFNVRLALFDVEKEEPVRGPNGLCIEAPYGEVGECLGKIGNGARETYSGYADKAASEKKILRDVFEKGDAYFRTGDLMKRDREEFFYFVDRIGDTFRWKGENVATSEVAGALSSFPGVKEANVYGVTVPGAEGRAGMAQLVVGDGFDIKALAAHVDHELPTAARPLFVRLQKEIETTGTFKYRKMDLVEAGFDPEKTQVATYYKNPKTGYVKITKPLLEKLDSGEVKL